MLSKVKRFTGLTLLDHSVNIPLPALTDSLAVALSTHWLVSMMWALS